MKTNLFIIALILGLFLYLLMSSSPTTKSLTGGIRDRRNYMIDIEKVNNYIVFIPEIAEINYFETDKDINNWFVFIDGRREKEQKILIRDKKNVSQGGYAGHLYLQDNRPIELVLVHFPENWSDFQYLLIDVNSARQGNEPLEIKIGDYFDAKRFYSESQKFKSSLILKRGLNTIKISINEIKNKIRIGSERKTLHLCFPNEHGINLFLDNLRLEK